MLQNLYLRSSLIVQIYFLQFMWKFHFPLNICSNICCDLQIIIINYSLITEAFHNILSVIPDEDNFINK